MTTGVLTETSGEDEFSLRMEKGLLDFDHHKYKAMHARVEWEPGGSVVLALFSRKGDRMVIEHLWDCGHKHRVLNDRCWHKGSGLASEFRCI